MSDDKSDKPSGLPAGAGQPVALETELKARIERHQTALSRHLQAVRIRKQTEPAIITPFCNRPMSDPL